MNISESAISFPNIFPVKRKRVHDNENVFGDLLVRDSKKPRQHQESVDVPWWENRAEFNGELEKVGRFAFFGERMQAFKECMAQTHENAWQLWLVDDELVLTEEPYVSNALSEASFLELAGESSTSQPYYRLQLVDGKEEDADARPLLDVLISPEGGAAQLMWIQSSQHGGLRGPEVLDLFISLADHIGWRASYLLDDAHGANGIVLRTMGAMTDTHGRTLYVKYGNFQALTCSGLKGVSDSDTDCLFFCVPPPINWTQIWLNHEIFPSIPQLAPMSHPSKVRRIVKDSLRR